MSFVFFSSFFTFILPLTNRVPCFLSHDEKRLFCQSYSETCSFKEQNKYHLHLQWDQVAWSHPSRWNINTQFPLLHWVGMRLKYVLLSNRWQGGMKALYAGESFCERPAGGFFQNKFHRSLGYGNQQETVNHEYKYHPLTRIITAYF